MPVGLWYEAPACLLAQCHEPLGHAAPRQRKLGRSRGHVKEHKSTMPQQAAHKRRTMNELEDCRGGTHSLANQLAGPPLDGNPAGVRRASRRSAQHSNMRFGHVGPGWLMAV